MKKSTKRYIAASAAFILAFGIAPSANAMHISALSFDYIRQKRNLTRDSFYQGYKDSNLEMTESESVALPFGDSPMS